MYRRRIKILIAVTALVFAVVIGRLWHLQIIAGGESRSQVQDALRDDQPLPAAARGRIMDRRGEFLAIDKPCQELCLDYRFLVNDSAWVRRQQRQIAEQESVSLRLAQRIYEARAENTWRMAAEFGNVTRQELEAAVARIVRRIKGISEIVGVEIREQRQAHPVLTGLDDAAAAAMREHLHEMAGATVRSGYIRFYPHGPLACHVIGITGQITAEEQERLNIPRGQADRLTTARNNYLGCDPIGKTGVEKMCESVLRGRRGYCKRKQSRDGFQILEEVLPEPGLDVKLTIDHNLQKELTELFLDQTSRQNLLSGARTGDRPSNGAIVILTVPEGEVLAMVSVPGYDLNRFHSDYATLAEDKADLPFLNRAVSRRYPPGSTAKPMTALAGLASGTISLQTSFTCDGRLAVGRKYLHCWTHWRHMPGHGTLDVSDAIKHSCNVFFYQVGAQLGLEQLSQWLVRLGFADVPGTGLPEEKAGTVPTAVWLAQFKPGYHPVPIDAMQIGIGQGFFGATPLQVANAMATIARGGKLRAPLLVKEGYSANERAVVDLNFNHAHIEAVREGMRRVVNEQGGTAYRVFRDSGAAGLDVEVYGKTGTATVPPADLNGDGHIDAYEQERTEMAWFAGFALAPAGGGQAAAERRGIAFAVVVEYVKGGGSQNAGPIAMEAIRIWRRSGNAE